MQKYLFILLLLLLVFSCDALQPEDCAGVAGGSNICGCTNSSALNYNSSATSDDGTCEYDTTSPTISSLSFDTWNCNYLDVCTQEYSWTSFDFSASVYDYGSGVDYVEAWVDYKSLGKDYYGPTYSWDWNPFYLTESAGYKTFKVRAYDEAGNYKEKTDTFNFVPYDN